MIKVLINGIDGHMGQMLLFWTDFVKSPKQWQDITVPLPEVTSILLQLNFKVTSMNLKISAFIPLQDICRKIEKEEGDGPGLPALPRN